MSKTIMAVGAHTGDAQLTCGMLLAFQNTPLDNAMFYDARFGTSVYGSMFNPLTAEPFPTYYAFKAFNELYKLGEQIEAEIDEKDIYAVAAKRGDSACVVITNPTERDTELSLSVEGKVTKCVITCEEKTEEEIPMPEILPKNSFESKTL